MFEPISKQGVMVRYLNAYKETAILQRYPICIWLVMAIQAHVSHPRDVSIGVDALYAPNYCYLRDTFEWQI